MSKDKNIIWETSTYVGEDGKTVWDVCEAGAGDMIADLKCVNNAENKARLIAAAPELLDALQVVKDSGYLDGGYQPTIDLVNNVIKKALGN